MYISLNPHPDDVLTDMEMENIAREYLERMGYGNQPYMVYIDISLPTECLDACFSQFQFFFLSTAPVAAST